MSKTIIIEEGLSWADAAFVAKDNYLFRVHFNPEDVCLRQVRYSEEDGAWIALSADRISFDELKSNYAIFRTEEEFKSILNNHNEDITKALNELYSEFMGEDLIAKLDSETNNNNIKEDTTMTNNTIKPTTKLTKVTVDMHGGKLIVTGANKRSYEVIIGESYSEMIKIYNNNMKDLQTTVTNLEDKNKALQIRVDNALKYFAESKKKTAPANPTTNTTNGKLDTNAKIVNTIQSVHMCDNPDCGKQITSQAADYCTRRPETFGGNTYCFSCQKTHAKRA